jgi:hypothetical protein
MPSLDDHFGALTKIRPPEESWLELRERPVGRLPRRPVPISTLGVAALALLVAAGGLIVAMRAFQRAEPAPGTSPSTMSPHPATAPAPSTSPKPEHESGMFGAMLEAIRDSSPSGWTFTLQKDRLDGDWGLDGNTDDGVGPGRLNVYVTFRAGMILAHPCADHEYRQGGLCVEHRLASGDLLALRDVVTGPDGMKTIEVTLVHTDGSGVGAEAGNWTIAPLPEGSVSQGSLPSPKVTRTDPLYTLEQLGRLVRAVDERTRACLREKCN